MFRGIDVASVIEHFLYRSASAILNHPSGTHPKVLNRFPVCWVGGSNEMVIVDIRGFR